MGAFMQMILGLLGKGAKAASSGIIKGASKVAGGAKGAIGKVGKAASEIGTSELGKELGTKSVANIKDAVKEQFATAKRNALGKGDVTQNYNNSPLVDFMGEQIQKQMGSEISELKDAYGMFKGVKDIFKGSNKLPPPTEIPTPASALGTTTIPGYIPHSYQERIARENLYRQKAERDVGNITNTGIFSGLKAGGAPNFTSRQNVGKEGFVEKLKEYFKGSLKQDYSEDRTTTPKRTKSIEPRKKGSLAKPKLDTRSRAIIEIKKKFPNINISEEDINTFLKNNPGF